MFLIHLFDGNNFSRVCSLLRQNEMLNCIPGECDFHRLVAGDGISSKLSWAGERKGNESSYSLHWAE